MTKRIVLATWNRGKLAEFRALLAGLDVEVLSVADMPGAPSEVIEDGQTCRENARKKAVAVARACGFPALADDSGLEIDALGGAPGVHSARFAGPRATDGENNRKVLSLLAEVIVPDRTARFRCVLCYVDPLDLEKGEEPHFEEGVCEGRIISAARGTAGFGYDPLFVPAGFERTLAELDANDKNSLSHRGKATAKMREWLSARFS